MKKKILGIFLMTLLILVTIFPVTGTMNFNGIKIVEKNNFSGRSPGDSFLEARSPVNPSVEITWPGTNPDIWNPNSTGVMSTPLVARLHGPYYNAIVFITFLTNDTDPNRIYKNGVLRAIWGNDGNRFFDVKNNDTCPISTPAIGDIDCDAYPEIIALEETVDNIKSYHLLAYTNHGDYKWTSSPDTAMNKVSAPVIADLDNDTFPEIIVGDIVFSNSGQRLSVGGQGNALGISCVADVDLDGAPEVIAGNTVYSYSTNVGLSVKWIDTNLSAGGLNAIGNFDNDSEAEIVLVNYSSPYAQVYLLNHDLTEIWHRDLNIPIDAPGGSPPTIDDYNGDGYPEIGVTTKKIYFVFDRFGTIIWQKDITDVSSGGTGSTVFDLNKDGIKDVIYSDEQTLRIWYGDNGIEQWSTPNPSGTSFEMPVVADVDGDNVAEFVVARNNYYNGSGSVNGIRIFGNDSKWSSARRTWNQHTYHITNVNDLYVGIPSPETNNWQKYNNYRVQTTNETNFPPLEPKILHQAIATIKVNIEYNISSVCFDPESDPVYYWFNWGDGTNSGWVGPYASGANASAKHTWTMKGLYLTKVKAKDIYDAESEWSNPLLVIVPRNRAIDNPIMVFFENHLLLFKIFQLLFKQLQV